MTSGRLRELKNKRKLKLSSLKVVAVAYERWSLTRGSNYSALTEKQFGILETWSLKRGGRLREVVGRGGSTLNG